MSTVKEAFKNFKNESLAKVMSLPDLFELWSEEIWQIGGWDVNHVKLVCILDFEHW